MSKNINKAIDFLNDKNIIKKSEISYMTKEEDLVKYLISSGINQDIIKNVLRDYFDRKFLTPEQINNFEQIYKSKFGFFINNVYYVKMITYYSSNIIKKMNKLYKGVLFDSIEIISDLDFEKIENRYNKLSIDVKNKNTNITKTLFMELFNEIMRSDFNKVFIDTRLDFYIKYYPSFSDKEYSDVFKNLKIDFIESVMSEMIDERGFYLNNKNYKIFYRVISDNSIEIELINYYKKSFDIENFETYKDVEASINSVSGLFLFSQKEQYDYFYQILDILTVQNDKKMVVLSDDRKENKATKNINLSDIDKIDAINEEIIRDFDVLMIENTNFLNSKTFKTINLFLSNSKKVIMFLTSKDAINSLANLIYNYPELKRDILTEYLNGIFHITQMPKLCESCKKPIKLIDVPNVRDDYPDILAKFDRKEIIYLRNKNGCIKCNHGYDGSVRIEQYVKKSGVLVSNILNFDITNVKNQLSAENNYRSINDKAENIVMKSKELSIEDIKTKI